MTVTVTEMPDTPANWVLAAPFRAHVRYLMEAAKVPWPLIASQAGVSRSAMQTLLYGRNGRERPKMSPQVAQALLTVTPDDLRWLRTAEVPAQTTGNRIRLLRSHDVSWDGIAHMLAIDVVTCQAIARGERTFCLAMTSMLAQWSCNELEVCFDDIEPACPEPHMSNR